MLHAKFQDRRNSGSGEDFFQLFIIILFIYMGAGAILVM